MNLQELQFVAYKWKQKNFPTSGAEEQFLGMVEELGELAHAKLKSKQGIRGVQNQKDAIGDLMIFLMNYCSDNGWSLNNIIHATWDEVSKRDWIIYPEDGMTK